MAKKKTNGGGKQSRKRNFSHRQLTLKEVEGPLGQVHRYGKIFAVVFETDNIYIHFWRKPNRKLLKTLQETVKKLEKALAK